MAEKFTSQETLFEGIDLYQHQTVVPSVWDWRYEIYFSTHSYLRPSSLSPHPNDVAFNYFIFESSLAFAFSQYLVLVALQFSIQPMSGDCGFLRTHPSCLNAQKAFSVFCCICATQVLHFVLYLLTNITHFPTNSIFYPFFHPTLQTAELVLSMFYLCSTNF